MMPKTSSKKLESFSAVSNWQKWQLLISGEDPLDIIGYDRVNYQKKSIEAHTVTHDLLQTKEKSLM